MDLSGPTLHSSPTSADPQAKIEAAAGRFAAGDMVGGLAGVRAALGVQTPLGLLYALRCGLLAQFDSFISATADRLGQFRKDPFDPAAVEAVRADRRHVAGQWLEASPEDVKDLYLGGLGKAHKLVLDSGLKDEHPTEDEAKFVKQIADGLRDWPQDPRSAGPFLAATLYLPPHLLPAPAQAFDLPRVPSWLLDDFVAYMLAPPAMFLAAGEADAYLHFMGRWVGYLHEHIVARGPDKPLEEPWGRAALAFTQRANYIPLYFNDANLKDLYVKRAGILDKTLRASGAAIDYAFPPVPAGRKRLRLGVLSAHLSAHTETYNTLPAFEHLDRTRFEVILYVLGANGSPAEAYCRSRADRFVALPQDYRAQVAAIRADDLDALLIGTNVTAVTNGIAVLALHRLARAQATLTTSPVTTGMRHVDYYISHPRLEPPQGAQGHYSERLVLMEETTCNPSKAPPATISPSRQQWGVPADALLFASGANFYKIIPELRRTWARVVAGTPGSVLLLFPFGPSWASSYPVAAFMRDIHAVFADHGIEPHRLLVLDVPPGRSNVKEVLKSADVYLDSFPYPGATSLLDPLEVGLPPLVMDGHCLRTRMAAFILRCMGLGDLVVNDQEQYVRKAIELGADADLRRRKREEIGRALSVQTLFSESSDYSAAMGRWLQTLPPGWPAGG